ncbi:MAG TPA: LPS assembly lipoprotein LptE [Castellaniella sp.]|uniref:LPS-assembly lipoprotein LptE n=1 Tax=Castellaniella sp. TaxID=1955812 RepID=UPI002F0EC9CF
MAALTPFQRTRRLCLALPCLAALSACGFHLKGATPLPFKSLYTNINLDSDFGARLRRAVEANSPDTHFTPSRKDAEVYLHEIADQQNLREVSLNAEGQVEEYELDLNFSFELLDREGHVLLAPTVLHNVREIPYNDRIVQAKDSEITRTFRDMRNSMIDQILRRMSAPDVREAYRNADSRPTVPLPGDEIWRSRDNVNKRGNLNTPGIP